MITNNAIDECNVKESVGGRVQVKNTVGDGQVLKQTVAHVCVDLLPSFRTNLSMISSKERGRGMSRSNHTEAQMIGALKQLEAGRKAEDVAREVGVSKHTIYAWKAKYGGMDVSEAQEAKQLRDENTKLKKLVVDLSLDKEMLKALIAKNGWSS
jgi:putative transposase